MAYHSQIRSSFIRDYCRRKTSYMESSWQLINERDEKHRALNKKYGFAEPDGTFGVGCKSHIDRDYKSHYDEIEARFRPQYEDQLPALYRWAREQGMTVYEYLLIDDIWDADLKQLAELTVERQDWNLRPIEEKARLLVSRWKEEHAVGEIQRRVKIESSNFHYAAARCRKMLELKLWELTAQKAILDYGREWKSSLEGAFGRLIAA